MGGSGRPRPLDVDFDLDHCPHRIQNGCPISRVLCEKWEPQTPAPPALTWMLTFEDPYRSCRAVSPHRIESAQGRVPQLCIRNPFCPNIHPFAQKLKRQQGISCGSGQGQAWKADAGVPVGMA